MPKARVEYRGGKSYTRGGRKWEQGTPQILTDAHEIEHYRATGGFSVTMLKDDQGPRGSRQEVAPTRDRGIGSVMVPEAIKPGRDVATVDGDLMPNEDDEDFEDEHGEHSDDFEEGLERDIGHDADKIGTGGHVESTDRVSTQRARERLPGSHTQGQVRQPNVQRPDPPAATRSTKQPSSPKLPPKHVPVEKDNDSKDKK